MLHGEAATGTSWEQLIETELFDPLGMDSCGFGPPGSADALDAPRGHDATGRGVHGDDAAVSIALERLTTFYPAVEVVDASDPSESITGHYWTDGTEAMICSSLAESFPPQCSGNIVAVSPELLAAGVELQEAHGIAWTERAITFQLPTSG